LVDPSRKIIIKCTQYIWRLTILLMNKVNKNVIMSSINLSIIDQFWQLRNIPVVIGTKATTLSD